MTTESAKRPPNHDRLLNRLLVVGCTASKAGTSSGPLPALELYNGGIVPSLRDWLITCPQALPRLRFLSAEHGLIHADTQLWHYDRPLDADRATRLRTGVWATLRHEMAANGVPTDVLVVVEPLYMTVLADLLAMPDRPRVHWISDARAWPQARTVLTEWEW